MGRAGHAALEVGQDALGTEPGGDDLGLPGVWDGAQVDHAQTLAHTLNPSPPGLTHPRRGLSDRQRAEVNSARRCYSVLASFNRPFQPQVAGAGTGVEGRSALIPPAR